KRLGCHGMAAQSSNPLPRNVKEMNDNCWNFWYNLSPVLFQELQSLMLQVPFWEPKVDQLELGGKWLHNDFPLQ
ncbi:hypothetical protein NPIL_253231, partial [Nephila pilipes]